MRTCENNFYNENYQAVESELRPQPFHQKNLKLTKILIFITKFQHYFTYHESHFPSKQSLSANQSVSLNQIKDKQRWKQIQAYKCMTTIHVHLRHLTTRIGNQEKVSLLVINADMVIKIRFGILQATGIIHHLQFPGNV